MSDVEWITHKLTHPVSSELFVAMMIYHITEIKKERVWFTKLIDLLSVYMDEHKVSGALDTLTDWVIIDGEYGMTENGRAGYLYYIDTHDGGDFRIKKLYDEFWKQITGGV
jgi:hypothetical protein